MLVLTRKQNEKIQIGETITITVLRMKGKAVRLGIQAPEDLSVLRGELVFDLDDCDEATASEAAEVETARVAGNPRRREASWPCDASVAKPVQKPTGVARSCRPAGQSCGERTSKT